MTAESDTVLDIMRRDARHAEAYCIQHGVIDGNPHHMAEQSRLAQGIVREAIVALELASRLCKDVLPHFNWGASALSAYDIQQLNTTPRSIEQALRSIKGALP
jgi:hypothetical protein